MYVPAVHVLCGRAVHCQRLLQLITVSVCLRLAMSIHGNAFNMSEGEPIESDFFSSDQPNGTEARRLLAVAANASPWSTEYWRSYYTAWKLDPFVYNSKFLPKLSRVVSNGVLTNFAGPTDARTYGAGSRVYWMGLKLGGCGYGDLVNSQGRPRSYSSKYPYMNAVGLTPSLMNALGMNGWTHGIGCGACIRAVCDDKNYCPNGATGAVGMVTDYCPENAGCVRLQADMFRATFLLATGNSPSNPRVKFVRVACPDPLTNIRVGVGVHWGPWGYLKVIFWNVAAFGVITKVEYSCCPSNMGVSSGRTHACSGGAKPIRVTLARTNGAMWATTKNTPQNRFCQFILYQEDGTALATKLTSPLKVGSADYNNDKWVVIRDTGVQFHQTLTDVLTGRKVSARGLGKATPAGR